MPPGRGGPSAEGERAMSVERQQLADTDVQTAPGATNGAAAEQPDGAAVELPNLLREGLRRERVAPPCAIVIFGASGDLTSRKLVPALYDLAVSRLLPAEF